MWFDQQSYNIRCEWGAGGVAALAGTVDVLVVVDVLSFSTCVDVATRHHAIVYPYPLKDESAAAFAQRIHGVLAGPRGSGSFSLSPASMTQASAGMRIVLPSLNGATLSRLTGSTPTLSGCFRNAGAVARCVGTFGPRVGVIPAGEQWPDGTLRPSLEDWLGAGAILSHLDGLFSPEASAARGAFEAHRGDLVAALKQCVSGRELIEQGWESDVLIAGELDVSATAPILRDGAYRAA